MKLPQSLPSSLLRRPSPSAFVSRTRPLSSTSTSPASTSTPSLSPATSEQQPTHFLVTLLRSPLHLPKNLHATCVSLGLSRRLSSSLVPITQRSAGAILSIKELVGVRNIVKESDGSEGIERIVRQKSQGEQRGFRKL